MDTILLQCTNCRSLITTWSPAIIVSQVDENVDEEFAYVFFFVYVFPFNPCADPFKWSIFLLFVFVLFVCWVVCLFVCWVVCLFVGLFVCLFAFLLFYFVFNLLIFYFFYRYIYIFDYFVLMEKVTDCTFIVVSKIEVFLRSVGHPLPNVNMRKHNLNNPVKSSVTRLYTSIHKEFFLCDNVGWC